MVPGERKDGNSERVSCEKQMHCHVVRRMEWDWWNEYILSVCSVGNVKFIDTSEAI